MKSAFFVALICFAIPAAGQFAGASVSGIVTDASGARIVAATVTIVRLLNGQVDALPVLERNFLVLAQLPPGSGPIAGTNTRFGVTKFGGVGDQRSGYTMLMDGGDVDDAQWGSPTINVSQDAVACSSAQ